MDYNLLLTWVSERGTGTWQQFREAHAWMEAVAAQGAGEVPASRTLEHLTRLGHVELARRDSKWSVAPPVVTVVPGASVHAVVVGARTAPFEMALVEAIGATQHLDLIRRTQAEGPDTLYVSCSDERILAEVAMQVGARYEYSVGERLSQLLPEIGVLLTTDAAPPPSPGYGMARWDPDSNRFTPTDNLGIPGLFRYEVYGATQFRFSPSAYRYVDLDFSTGRFAELNRLDRSVLTYEREAINGILRVPVKADLPALQARAAILCSGLLPQFDKATLTRGYLNVPRVIAERIGASLGQTLRTTERRRDS